MAQNNRVVVTCSKPFESVVAALESAIGRPNISEFKIAIASTKTYDELKQIVEQAVGKSGLMEFVRFDMGEVLRKQPGQGSAKSLRLLIGNPVIMRSMTEHVPDAAFLRSGNGPYR